MFHLTSTERKALIFITGLIIVGSVFRLFSIKSRVPLKISDTAGSATPLIISLNNATALELERLPGIGSRIASDIIAYRNQYGNFTDLNDLDNVKGIGSKKLMVIKEYLSL